MPVTPTGSRRGPKDLYRIGVTEKLILNYLDAKALRYRRSKIKKYSTPKEISEDIKKSPRTVSNALLRLRARGLVIVHESKRKYGQLFGPDWSRTPVWLELRKERGAKKYVTATYRFDGSTVNEEWEDELPNLFCG